MATNPTTESNFRKHAITGLGGAVGASAVFGLFVSEVLPGVPIPMEILEAVGAGLGASVAHTLDTGLDAAQVWSALKDVKMVFGTAALFYLLGYWPVNTEQIILRGAITPVRGWVAGAVSSWYSD